MDFELTQEQKMLAESAASFAKKTSPVERLRKIRSMPHVEGVEQRHAAKADPRNWEPAVWKQMAELGWLGLFYPESVGGLGLRFFDASLVIEKLGTTLVPEPYVASVVLAGWALLKAGSAEQHAKYLTPMIEGDTSLALAWQERHSRYDVTKVKTVAKKSGGGHALTGEKVLVLNGHAADHVVVSARTEDGALALFVVDAKSKGVAIESITTMDSGRAAQIRLEGAEGVLLTGGDAQVALEWALDLAAAAACAEGLGIARTVLDMTNAYLKVRKQFGVPIGTFQVLQHRAVDMFVQTQLLESTAILAAVRADDEDADERRRAVSIAKARLTAGGKYVTQQSVQLHGGIGITDEHDVGLYFKRMQVLCTLFGDDEFHLTRFASRDAFASTVGE
ncbi:acyl-CoA dehydrogenase family protein [Sandaracinus amylolyticus]|uniref:Acyl-CoA dehydrogenase family protein n=1 Tax=Sandaracinus amylolyticus TaxID=927083 RepID=A0A0F6YLJ4_9BACT|nr:acyl-CoA dehydrogenase family protein [Sandaracinus amylolyticus]AKF09528.1 Acyl-CoA dehydrogenase family protein [Sandaracinus amylolyticus]